MGIELLSNRSQYFRYNIMEKTTFSKKLAQNTRTVELRIPNMYKFRFVQSCTVSLMVQFLNGCDFFDAILYSCVLVPFLMASYTSQLQLWSRPGPLVQTIPKPIYKKPSGFQRVLNSNNLFLSPHYIQILTVVIKTVDSLLLEQYRSRFF